VDLILQKFDYILNSCGRGRITCSTKPNEANDAGNLWVVPPGPDWRQNRICKKIPGTFICNESLLSHTGARFCSANHQMMASKDAALGGNLDMGRHKDICGVLSKWRQVVKDGVSPDSCTADLLAVLQRCDECWMPRRRRGSTSWVVTAYQTCQPTLMPAVRLDQELGIATPAREEGG
jgi:hypothetical protein